MEPGILNTVLSLSSQKRPFDKINSEANTSLSSPGNPILRSTMVVEELGSRKDLGAQDGPWPGHHHRVGEEAEEEAVDRLSLRQPQEPQLLGVQIFLLRVPRDPQCCRCVSHFSRVMLLNSYFQVRCFWWIAFSTEHFSLSELKSYHLRREIKKIGSTRWWAGKRMNSIESVSPSLLTSERLGLSKLWLHGFHISSDIHGGENGENWIGRDIILNWPFLFSYPTLIYFCCMF